MKLTDICLSYGEKTVYKNFSVDIPDHKITCILGASGCGKTSLLNVISSSINYQGTVDPKPEKVSYIFQDPTLLPALTVEKNIEYVLKKEIKDKISRKKTVEDILEAVGLSAEKKSYPHTLSGGMAQRVSLARAFVYPSDVLLCDEPFQGLDVALKKQILQLFSGLYERTQKTTVFVTHDIDEAILIADKIIILANNAVKGEFYCSDDRSNRKLTDFTQLKEEIYKFF